MYYVLANVTSRLDEHTINKKTMIQPNQWLTPTANSRYIEIGNTTFVLICVAEKNVVKYVSGLT